MSKHYARVIEASRRARFDIDADVIRGRDFDLGRKFLPDGLALIGRFDSLDADQRSAPRTRPSRPTWARSSSVWPPEEVVMHEYIIHGSLGLTRGSLLRIEDGRGILVYVWEGELWLTEQGERRDRVLRSGEWHRLERDGAAVGYALKRCSITLTAPQPEHYARRVLVARAGSVAPVELYNSAAARGVRVAARLRRLWAGLFAPWARPTTAAL
jgi:hypothetical protein